MSGMKITQTPQKSSKIVDLVHKIREAEDPLDIMLNYDYLLDEIEGQSDDSRFGRSIPRTYNANLVLGNSHSEEQVEAFEYSRMVNSIKAWIKKNKDWF